MTDVPISVSVNIDGWVGSVQIVGDPHDFAVVTAMSRAVQEALLGWQRAQD